MGELQHLPSSASSEDLVAALQSDGGVIVDDLAGGDAARPLRGRAAALARRHPLWRGGLHRAGDPPHRRPDRPLPRRARAAVSTRWSSGPPPDCWRTPRPSSSTSRRPSPSARGAGAADPPRPVGVRLLPVPRRLRRAAATRSGRSPTSPRPTAPPASCPAATRRRDRLRHFDAADTVPAEMSARLGARLQRQRLPRRRRQHAPTMSASASTSPTPGRGCARRRTSTSASRSRWPARWMTTSSASSGTPAAPTPSATSTTAETRSTSCATAPGRSASGRTDRAPLTVRRAVR